VLSLPDMTTQPGLAHDPSWGMLPTISLTSAFGLLLVAFANNVARNSVFAAEWLFWPAVLVLYVPALSRLLSYKVARRERIDLLLVVGLSFYVLKLLHSPTHFTFFDEHLHWKTAIDIVRTQHLFSENTILPVSSLYPGLEIVTTALSNLSGLSIFEAGVVILAVGRVLFILALFLFFERITHSMRLASLAVMLYMANSSFVFFDAQFAYESLSLPMTAFVLFAMVFRQQSENRDSGRAQFAFIVLGIVAIAVSHHLTMYALTAFLWLWTIWAYFRSSDREQVTQLGIIALIALIASIAWAEVAGNAPFGYLRPVLEGGLSDLIAIIRNELSMRELFQSASGISAPIWERFVGFGAVACILLGLPYGLLQVWKRSRRNALALALASVVFAYPLSLAFRFTAHGWEISNRSSEFLFLGIAFVLASAGLAFMLKDGLRERRKLIIAIWVSVIFTGGIIAGWPPWARLPGPYMVAADTRSIESQGIAAAEWTKLNLGTDNRIAADRINRILGATYGQQRPVTVLNDKVDVSPIFYAPKVTPEEVKLIERLQLRYLVVDYRLTKSRPAFGVYFEVDKPKTPMPASSLAKFDGLSNVNRIFDSGDIAIYDVSKLYVNSSNSGNSQTP
jgi:hypothetical protein